MLRCHFCRCYAVVRGLQSSSTKYNSVSHFSICERLATSLAQPDVFPVVTESYVRVNLLYLLLEQGALVQDLLQGLWQEAAVAWDVII